MWVLKVSGSHPSSLNRKSKKGIDLQLNHLLDVDVDGRDVGVVLVV